jgi:sporulation protein YlmC with PRC-barrel domain
LVVHPKNQEITHVVVKESNSPHQERLIPVDWIRDATPSRIDLRCTQTEVSHADSFVETRFVKVEVPKAMGYGLGYGYAYAWPYEYTYADETIPVEDEVIPPGELAIHKDARVDASDGHIGKIDELLMDPITHKISHLVLRKGHLWGQRDVVIPVDEIDYIGEEVVHLKSDKQAVEALPAEPIRH